MSEKNKYKEKSTYATVHLINPAPFLPQLPNKFPLVLAVSKQISSAFVAGSAKET